MCFSQSVHKVQFKPYSADTDTVWASVLTCANSKLLNLTMICMALDECYSNISANVSCLS